MGTLQQSVGGHLPAADAPQRSFKDALTEHAGPNPLFFSTPDSRPEPDSALPGKHKGFPAIAFSKPHVQRIASSFQWALIGKFSQGYNKEHPHLGRPPVERLHKYFESLDFRGTYQIGLLDNRHLLIQFHLQEDFLHMYSRPVWYIKGIPMRIFKWSSNFHVDREIPLAPVWISLPRLPVHFFERSTVFAIASLLGTPLRLDSATASLKRPSMARVQIELDLLKDHPQKIWISTEGEEGFWQKVDYENVPPYCQHCWHIGHSESMCHVHHPELKPATHASTSKRDPQAALRVSTKYVPKVPLQSHGTASGLPCDEPLTQPTVNIDPPLLVGSAPLPEGSTPLPLRCRWIMLCWLLRMLHFF